MLFQPSSPSRNSLNEDFFTPSKYPSRHPRYHLRETIEPLREVHCGAANKLRMPKGIRGTTEHAGCRLATAPTPQQQSSIESLLRIQMQYSYNYNTEGLLQAAGCCQGVDLQLSLSSLSSEVEMPSSVSFSLKA